MKNINKIKLTPNATIKEALQIIDVGAVKFAVIVKDNNFLLGTITDGDIRRAILDGKSLEDSIEDIYFRTPTTVTVKSTKEEIINICTSKKIYQIPVIDEHGHVIDIKILDELLKAQVQNNKVVLMVGGLGTRLRPLTEHTPKPMLKVGNKPILETIILSFKKYGFTNIILSVNYKSEVIKEYFKDGSKLGVTIEYIHEEKRMGTAGALSLMRDKLLEPFFIMNGDLLTNIDFENMMDYHLKNSAMATMGVREYDFQVPYGVVNVNGIDIENIEEKPVHNFFVNAGVYILSEEILPLIPNDEFYDMPTLFEKTIANKMKTISFPIREYWLDIGRIEEFKKANSEYHEVFNV